MATKKATPAKAAKPKAAPKAKAPAKAKPAAKAKSAKAPKAKSAPASKTKASAKAPARTQAPVESTPSPASPPPAPAPSAAPKETLPATSSGGGPVVLLPAEIAPKWRGTLPPEGASVPAGWTWGKSGGPITDYDRALEPKDALQTARGGLGWLDVAQGRALIFDGEQTTVWVAQDDGGVVVRGPDVSPVQPDRVRASVPAGGWKTFLDGITLEDGRVFLFDSAFNGAASPQEIGADDGVAVGSPGPGTYAVSLAQVGTTDFIRLTRTGKPAKAGKAKAPFAKPAVPSDAAVTLTDESGWKTRPIKRAEVPRGPGLVAKHKISFPSVAPDGTVLGRTRGAVAESQFVRIGADGAQVPVSAPGQLLYAAFDTDGRRILATTADGKLLEFPADAEASQAKQRFDAGGRVWSLHPLSPTRAIVVQDRTVHLLRTEGATWEVRDSVSVAPITLPAVDLLGGNRWVLVGRDPEIQLYAVVNDKLRRVQTWTQTEGGLTVHDGRPFLYTKGSLDYDEILNLDEVYATLS